MRNTLQDISLPFAMPTDFPSLRAYYWTLDRIAESMNDIYNAPLCEPIGDQVAGWADNVRKVQGEVADAVRGLPPADKLDKELKVTLLLHWAGQCGEGLADQLKVITDELAREGGGE